MYGISEVEARNSEHVMQLLRIGNRNRSVEATAANEVSSRSHAVLQVVVEQKEKVPGRVANVKVSSIVDILTKVVVTDGVM